MPDSTNPSGWSTYRRLLSYVGNYAPALAIAIVGFLLYALTQSAFASLMQYVPSAFETTQDTSKLRPWELALGLDTREGIRQFLPLAIIAVVSLRGLGSYLGGYYISFVARNVVNQIRREVFQHINALPSGFFGKNNSGQLISTLTFNVEQVAAASSNAIKTVIREGFTVIALIGYLLYLNWQLSLLFFMAAPLIGLIIRVASSRFKRYSRRIQQSMGGVTHVASEAIRGQAIVRAFGGEAYENQRFADRCKTSLKNELKLARVNEISTPVIQILTFSAIALLFWFGLDPAWFGSLDAGVFLAYITAASLVAKPLRQISNVNSAIQRGIAAAESIFAVLDTPLEESQGKQELAAYTGNLELKNLRFRYPNATENALDGISLTARSGQVIALVGRSGAGKTTLIDLIAGFQRPADDQIFFDGQSSQTLSQHSIRQNVAIVTQDTVLFEDTVRANIAYGELADHTDAEVIEAAKKANAWDFIQSLPEGLNTQVGEGGASLSGGQKQRIALARAFLKNAPILILDEATSALDNESERAVQEAMPDIIKGRTTFVIAHRLSTVERADTILVLDQGQVVEQGKHDELLAADGLYAHLHRSQFHD
jgi:subfamily B ATP-binding cassette protein MsbA